MALKNLFKLEKLKINVYGNRLRSGLPQKTFKVMFNPASFSMKHENVLQKKQGVNTSGASMRYAYSRSEELALDLVFDGTGVSDFGVTTLIGKGTKSVSAQIDEFLTLCFHMDGKIHEPKFLKIEWGDGVLKAFDCRLKSVGIKYTLFDRSGAPLRADLDTVFVEDTEPKKRLRQEGKGSPDVPHTRVVKSGDTLPLLSKEVYGDSSYYLRVAQANNLDDFRNLQPGQEIFFPPLAR
jgi:hypothetical protein